MREIKIGGDGFVKINLSLDPMEPTFVTDPSDPMYQSAWWARECSMDLGNVYSHLARQHYVSPHDVPRFALNWRDYRRNHGQSRHIPTIQQL